MVTAEKNFVLLFAGITSLIAAAILITTQLKSPAHKPTIPLAQTTIFSRDVAATLIIEKNNIVIPQPEKEKEKPFATISKTIDEKEDHLESKIEKEEQEEEDEYIISDAAHSRSHWYRELSKYNPNYYKVRSLYNNYFKNKKIKKSYQTNAYMRFLQKANKNIDANGYIVQYNNIEKHSPTFDAPPPVGGPWTQIFTRWNTTQPRKNDGVGVVRSVAIDPANTSRVLVGGSLAGIWKTNDKGVNWTSVGQGIPQVKYVNHIAYVRNTPSTVFAMTDMGVVKSTNSGDSWTYTGLNNTAFFPQSFGDQVWLGLTSHSVDTVYATIKQGSQYLLKRTTDGGANWTTMQTFSSNAKIWDMKVHPNNGNIVYLLKQESGGLWINFWRSTDGGSNFSKISNGFPADANIDTHRARLAVTPANGNVVYIAIGYNGGGTSDKISFFKSSDEGVSFNKKCCGSISQPLENAMGTTDYLYSDCHLAQLSWNFAFNISETDENKLACAANKLKVSNDGGATWKYDFNNVTTTGSQYDNYASCPGHFGVHGDHHGIAWTGNELWDTNDGGVYYSADGGNTVVKDYTDGLAVQEIWGFGQTFKKNVMAAGLNHNAINMLDESAYGGWVRINGADAMAANVNPIDDQYLYTHPWGHEKVKRNLTSNSNHQISPLGIQLGYITLDNIDFHPNLYYTIYASDYGDRNDSFRIAKTSNNAANWKIIKSFAAEQKNAVAVKVSYADTNFVYAVVEPNKVWKSADAGSTWTDVSPSTSLIGTYALWRLAVSDKNPNHIWVTVKAHQNMVKVIKSTDGGATWQDYSTGLPTYAITSLIYQRGSDDGLYAGTTYGVYYRKNGMSSWQQVGANLPATDVNFLHINYALGKLRIGTERGLWETDLVELTAPKANISANLREVCPSIESAVVQFADYSVLHNDAQTAYSWSFPGGSPATSTSERPLVSYANAAPGNYNVTLTVTDQYGSNTQTLTNFIKVDCNGYTNCTNPQELPKSNWSLMYASSQESGDPATNAFDGDPNTMWHTKWSSTPDPFPHEIQINLGDTFRLSQFKYTPRQDGNVNGRVKNFELYVSSSTSSWGTAVATGSFANDATQKLVNFTAKDGRYIRFVALSEVNNNIWAAAGEIAVSGCLAPPALPAQCSNAQLIDKSAWTIVSVSSQEITNENAAATNIFDDNNNTYWHTQWSGTAATYPHDIQIDMNANYEVNNFKYLPRQDGNINGRVKDYELYVSSSATNWGSAVATGSFENDSTGKTVIFPVKTGRYIRFRPISEVNGNAWACAAEINATGCALQTCPSGNDNLSNNSFVTAVKIPTNKDVKGLINAKSDVDYYKLTVTTGGPLTINLTTLPANYTLTLYNSTQTQVAISQQSGTQNETINYNVVAGTYYIKVNGVSNAFNSSSCYTLKVIAGTAILNNLSNKQLIYIQPNPVSDNIHFFLPEHKKSGLVKLYAMEGKLVLQIKIISPVTDIEVNRLQAGVYMLVFSDGAEKEIIKVVKL